MYKDYGIRIQQHFFSRYSLISINTERKSLHFKFLPAILSVEKRLTKENFLLLRYSALEKVPNFLRSHFRGTNLSQSACRKQKKLKNERRYHPFPKLKSSVKIKIPGYWEEKSHYA